METKTKKAIEWRRYKVAELDSQGHSQPEIASLLKTSLGTINGDLMFLRQQAKQSLRQHLDERLPYEYERCLIALNLIQKRAWNITEETKSTKEKLQALSLAKECCEKKLDLLTNATVIEDAIRSVSNHVNPIPAPPPAADEVNSQN